MPIDERIIYPTDEGGVAVIIPCISVERAIKDVPEGKEYKVINIADLPQDRTFRDAWEYTP